jgi:hypothetical protein
MHNTIVLSLNTQTILKLKLLECRNYNNDNPYAVSEGLCHNYTVCVFGFAHMTIKHQYLPKFQSGCHVNVKAQYNVFFKEKSHGIECSCAIVPYDILLFRYCEDKHGY